VKHGHAVGDKAVATQAQAGSEILPGITTGIALGAAPPQGGYVLQLPSYGYTNSTPGLNLGVAVPAWVIWSTPWGKSRERLRHRGRQ